MEENRSFSFSGLIIKIIIVLVFVLFTVWLLSLGTKDLSNSLDVLTDSIFSQNIEKMKEVGKEYFTTERLPKKIGEVETLTLKEMYEKKLILELTDKKGNACSAKDSYVSIEKYDDEYQMKVYLECGDESDYIIVIMGCYDYCDTDICEKETTSNKKIEYQYVKTTNGKWTDYGNWSEWSKVSVTNNDYRQIETNVVKEEYSYDKEVSKIDYEKLDATCPTGYTKDGNTCVKVVSSTKKTDPVCSAMDGYKFIGRYGFTCNYSKDITDVSIETTTKDVICPSGYTKSGNTCLKNTTISADPVCPAMDGYKVTRNGFDCTYVKTTSSSVISTCPKMDGYTVSRDGKSCVYKRYVKGSYVGMESGSQVPADGVDKTDKKMYIYEEVGTAEYKYACLEECKMQWVHTWEKYNAKVEKITKNATCPTGYTLNGSNCVKSVTDTKTGTATCPSEYTVSGNTCVKSATTSKNLACPIVSGYEYTGRDGLTCNYKKTVSKNNTITTTGTAICPTGYTGSSDSCYMNVTETLEEDLIKSCPVGYKETADGSKCFKEIISLETVKDTKDVTYYRYRVREYKGGTTDYKWSTSKSDKKLLDAGYKLTGNTR